MKPYNKMPNDNSETPLPIDLLGIEALHSISFVNYMDEVI